MPIKDVLLPLLSAVLLGAAAPAQAAQGAICLTRPEAESVVQVLLPDVLVAAGGVCAGYIPPQSVLRDPQGPVIMRFRADAAAAWPGARAVVQRLAPPEMAGLVNNDLLRTVLTAALAPAIAGNIKPADCPTFDRVVNLLSPLPARNIAALLVEFNVLGTKNGKSPIPICGVTPPPPAGRP